MQMTPQLTPQDTYRNWREIWRDLADAPNLDYFPPAIEKLHPAGQNVFSGLTRWINDMLVYTAWYGRALLQDDLLAIKRLDKFEQELLLWQVQGAILQD